jgi:hypothetical protein
VASLVRVGIVRLCIKTHIVVLIVAECMHLVTGNVSFTWTRKLLRNLQLRTLSPLLMNGNSSWNANKKLGGNHMHPLQAILEVLMLQLEISISLTPNTTSFNMHHIL